MKTIFVSLEKEKFIVPFIFFVLFAAFVLIAFPKQAWMDIFIPVGAIVLIIILITGIYIRPVRKAKLLFEKLRIDETRITFPEPLEVEDGFFEAIGEWRPGKDNRSYQVERKFLSVKKEDTMELKLKGESFFIAIARTGEGRIYLPGIRVLDEKFKDTLILYARPGYAVSFSEEKISVLYNEDRAELRVSRTNNGFRSFLYIYSDFRTARKAKVELVAYTGAVEVKKTLIEARSSVEFEHRFLDETIVAVSHKKVLSPLRMQKELKLGELIAGHESFILRLSLDLPLRRDVNADLELNVKPNED